MDGHGFDLLTKRLARLTTRRQGLRAVVAATAAGGVLGWNQEDAAAACGGPGKRCKNGSSCCSAICLRGRKKKGKKTKGRCDCSFPQEACNVGGDCCFAGSDCGDNGCDPDNRCCFGEGAECIDPCECCNGFTCNFEGGGEFGVCVPCKALGDLCVVGVDFCCGTEFCESNGGSGGEDVCCLGPVGECADDAECCGDRRCSSRAQNSCQFCPALGEACIAQNNTCCDAAAACMDNACGGNNVCCLPEGETCESDCDCCEIYRCNPTSKTCVFDLGRVSPESESESESESEPQSQGGPRAANGGARNRRRAKAGASGKSSHGRRRRR